ncbi:peptidoglycan-associated lipoprotein Pal [Ramlibacter rhizophilus]|uniref:Peptidoglycan-associated lipoprotein n=1 Tax=Ramlibacter rhizophilus TaxID=1781167 RepID=A0A4Z0C3Q7_9BURK|nr:peptidoglycan-associated lipoprotein Pal [Ramlibacter rhizophilus]TFZ04845.1 peptidoglycan-associated lipoprotein Pal [Ramlibacter rhizophilus]
MKKHLWGTVVLAAALAGCGSSVKLEDVPVVDRTATPGGGAGSTVPGGGAAVDPNAAAQSRVAPVAADEVGRQAPGPVGVGRVILFDYDSFVIKPEFQPLVEAHAKYLKANNGRRMTIEGHTDERGGREYNLALGQKRAEAVRRALVLLGVADSQLEPVSFGEEKPAEAGTEESSWARNRRAELAYR